MVLFNNFSKGTAADYIATTGLEALGSEQAAFSMGRFRAPLTFRGAQFNAKPLSFAEGPIILHLAVGSQGKKILARRKRHSCEVELMTSRNQTQTTLNHQATCYGRVHHVTFEMAPESRTRPSYR